MKTLIRFTLFCVLTVAGVPALCPHAVAQEEEQSEVFQEALDTLNDSPWARHRTVTRVVPGIGSGEYGEKELFSRYYVRLLSAGPIQEAYRKVLRGTVVEEEGQMGEGSPANLIGSGAESGLVIGVAFRSNLPDLESEVQNTFLAQTLETVRGRAFLSTSRFPRLEPIGYYPPTQPALGAQFIFPLRREGRFILGDEDATFVFELTLPADVPELRITFPVSDEVLQLDPGPETELERTQTVSEFRIGRFEGRPADSTGRVDLSAGHLGGVVNLFPEQRPAAAFHGSLYEYHRNDNLDARNFFDPVGEPLPEFKRNQFGGSLGVQLGPQLNLFGSYDGLRINQGSTLLSNVPTPEMKRGDFGRFLDRDSGPRIIDPESGQPFPGNRIPEDRISPVSRRLLHLIPDPNRDDPVRNFVNSQPLVQDRDLYTGRADIGVDEKSQITAQFNFEKGSEIDVAPLPEFGGRETGREYRASTSYTRSLDASTVMVFRAEFDRNEELETAVRERPAGLLESLGIEGVTVEGPEDEGYPFFDLAGYPDFGDEGFPQHEVENRYEVAGDVTVARGDHLFGFSGEVDFRQLNDSRSNALERGEFSFSGIYTGDSFADFLLGRSDSATRAVGSSRQDLRNHALQFEFVDEWRVNPRVTLTLGLGYEYSSPYRSIRPNIAVFQPLLFEPPLDGALLPLDEATDLQKSDLTVVEPDRNDFSPRIGLAYRPFGSSWLVLRASYNIFHGGIPSYIYENYMGRNFPFYYLQAAQASRDSGGLNLEAPFLTDTPTELRVRDISRTLSAPYYHDWDLVVQNELGELWSLDLSLRGRKGLHELRTIPGNVPLPGTGEIQARRPNPDFGEFAIVTGGGSSLFYELQFEVQRRLRDGFTFEAIFEWRRRFDDEFSEDPSNPRNLRAEWAPSGFFGSKRLRLNYIVDLPFGQGQLLEGPSALDFLIGGWRLSGIARISSGSPFSVVLPGDFNNDGLSSDRPDLVRSPDLSGESQTIDRWFDTGAFTQPDPSGFGNAGRNIIVGPGFHAWDMSLVKDFVLVNDHRVQLRFAFFNALNQANFDDPNPVLGTQVFGVVTGARRAREIEIALKYSF